MNAVQPSSGPVYRCINALCANHCSEGNFTNVREGVYHTTITKMGKPALLTPCSVQ